MKSGSNAEKFEPLQEKIIAAAMTQGVKLVVAENTYMYGDVEGEIHEGLPYRANTKKGRIRAKLADRLLDLYRAGKLASVFGDRVEGIRLHLSKISGRCTINSR